MQPIEQIDAADKNLRAVLSNALGIPRARVETYTPETPLFGAIPELDSLAVAVLLNEIEDQLGIQIDDDEMDSEILETFGNLLTYVKAKTQT